MAGAAVPFPAIFAGAAPFPPANVQYVLVSAPSLGAAGVSSVRPASSSTAAAHSPAAITDVKPIAAGEEASESATAAPAAPVAPPPFQVQYVFVPVSTIAPASSASSKDTTLALVADDSTAALRAQLAKQQAQIDALQAQLSSARRETAMVAAGGAGGYSQQQGGPYGYGPSPYPPAYPYPYPPYGAPYPYGYPPYPYPPGGGYVDGPGFGTAVGTAGLGLGALALGLTVGALAL